MISAMALGVWAIHQKNSSRHSDLPNSLNLRSDKYVVCFLLGAIDIF